MKFTIERLWNSEGVRTACVKSGFYTLGANREYENMLNIVDENKRNPDDRVIYEVAQDIFSHSDKNTGLEVTDVLYVLLNDVVCYLPVA